MSEPQDKPKKQLNAFQVLGGVLAALAGVRGVSQRGQSLMDASNSAILLAFAMFVAGIYGAFRLMIYFISTP